MASLQNYITQNKQRFLDELFDLLKIPSISADKKYEKDIAATAEFVKKSLEKAGCKKVEICETKGYPIVYAEHIIDESLPTVLVYGHYDVQPPDPLDLWKSPLFCSRLFPETFLQIQPPQQCLFHIFYQH